MDPRTTPMLDWIAGQSAQMALLTEQWAHINSGSYNLEGLRRMRTVLAEAFAPLGGAAELLPLAPISQVNAAGEVIEVPIAEALSIVKRPEAPVQVLLVGHMDTVYGPEHPFQRVTMLDANTMNGPGVADLKGGLVVMLHALQALEQSPWASQIGWQVLLNPDEEIGSIASDPELKKAAVGKTVGLIYEPALADGTLAGARKGSGNFSITVRGRAAHAGRNPQDGRNAIVSASELSLKLFALNGRRHGVTVNPARIEGGGPLNVVPDLAIVRFNIRTRELADEAWAMDLLEQMVAEINARDGFSATLHGHFTRPPKPMAAPIEKLFALVFACGRELGLEISAKPSGGCCDGNNLWKYGLPNVDTLGVRGANIHSAKEVMYVDSLVERAQLSALLLMKLAQGEYQA